MNYKETLFFVGKCLTINHEEHNKILVEEQLKSDKVDWDEVVKLSTAHYVFPALYINLKKADFLKYIPDDLVEYMQHITDLNRERNQQIIDQAKELNELLLANNITPIFLKGTTHLLEGLYDDIAERMVGDIDFLVDENSVTKAYEVITKKGNYKNENIEDFLGKNHRHLRRIINDDRIAAVEIHRHLTSKNHIENFNFNNVKYLKLGSFMLLNYDYQLCHSIIDKQINNNGNRYKDISLKNSYDVFLLSKRCNTLSAIKEVEKLFNSSNNFLMLTYKVFNEPKSIQFLKNTKAELFYKEFSEIIDNPKKIKKRLKLDRNIHTLKTIPKVLFKRLIKKSYRDEFIKKILNKEWQNQKLIQLGFKKATQES